MIVLGVDPGGTTGFATVENGRVTEMGTVKLEGFHVWLAEQEPDVMVVENYRIRPAAPGQKGANLWQAPVALKLIGAMEYHCLLKDVTFVLQEPAVKVVGYGWGHLNTDSKKKGNHELDAAAHAYYWWGKNKGHGYAGMQTM